MKSLINGLKEFIREFPPEVLVGGTMPLGIGAGCNLILTGTFTLVGLSTFPVVMSAVCFIGGFYLMGAAT